MLLPHTHKHTPRTNIPQRGRTHEKVIEKKRLLGPCKKTFLSVQSSLRQHKFTHSDSPCRLSCESRKRSVHHLLMMPWRQNGPTCQCSGPPAVLRQAGPDLHFHLLSVPTRVTVGFPAERSTSHGRVAAPLWFRFMGS